MNGIMAMMARIHEAEDAINDILGDSPPIPWDVSTEQLERPMKVSLSEGQLRTMRAALRLTCLTLGPDDDDDDSFDGDLDPDATPLTVPSDDLPPVDHGDPPGGSD